MNTYPLSDPVVLVFVLIPVLLAGTLLRGLAAASTALGEPPETTRTVVVRTGIWIAAWLAVTWAAARRGLLLRFDDTPPPFALLVAAIVLIAVVLAFGPDGRRLVRGLPIWTLVAVQAFRLPLELAMHALYERGIMPEQMSYSGRNFDILTGITAIAVAVLVRAGVGGTRLVVVWNVMGLALLVNIVAVAILSTPRFRAFGDDHLNTFVMYAPFVWLPAVMVLAALAGHLLIFRALRHDA